MTKRTANLNEQVDFNNFYVFRPLKTPIWGYCRKILYSNFALSLRI